MSRITEIAEAEAAEAEAEDAQAQDAAESADDEPEADAEPSSNLNVDKALAQMEKENTRHAAAVARIMGADFELVYPCPTCQDFAAGFTFTPPDETPAMQHVPEFQRCEKCAGHGQVLTGALPSATVATTCRGCSGQGYIEVPLPPATPAYTPPQQPANGDQDTINALIARGYMVLPPASPTPGV